jgi:TonB family protein
MWQKHVTRIAYVGLFFSASAHAAALADTQSQPAPGLHEASPDLSGNCLFKSGFQDVSVNSTLMAEFLVAPDGHVRDSKIVQSGGNASNDQLVMTTLSACQWRPATQDGHSVAEARWTKFRVKFTPPTPDDANAGPLVRPTFAVAKDCTLPEYPQEARHNGEAGVVTAEYLVGPDGHVLNARVVRSSGSPSLDKATLDGLSKCVWKPATRNGQVVSEAVWASLNYTWRVQP